MNDVQANLRLQKCKSQSFEGDIFNDIFNETVVLIRDVCHDVGRLIQLFKDNFMFRRSLSVLVLLFPVDVIPRSDPF